MRRPILTMTTDFGLHGSHVAEMKGIVLGLVPDAVIVDVCHTIAPQAVSEGACVLERLAGAFPYDTVHLAVVDPGVGTARGLIAVRAAYQWWLAPDNGLLHRVLSGYAPSSAVAIENPTLRRTQVSSTFHGRDILAPAAAHLLRGKPASELGRKVVVADLVPLADQEPVAVPGGYQARVLFVDSFGNLVTNLHREHLVRTRDWEIAVGACRLRGLATTYADQPVGSLVALIGSAGYLEIAEVNGSAARTLGIGVGAALSCVRGGMT